MSSHQPFTHPGTDSASPATVVPVIDASPPATGFERSWKSDSLVVFSGTVASAFVSALYVGVAARMLGPSEYGIVVALLALSSGLTVVLEPVENEIARGAAELVGLGRPDEIGRLFRHAVQRIAPSAALLGVVLVCIAPVLDRWLGLTSLAPAFLFAAYAGGVLFHTIPRALMRGQHRFDMYAANETLDASLRCAAGLLAVKLGMGASGMLLGYAVGVILATVVGLFQLRHSLQVQAPTLPAASTSMSTVSGPFIFVSLYSIVVMNADVLVAKQELSASDAGLYGAASTLSRMGAIAAAPVAVVLLSKVASLRARGASVVPIVAAATGVVGAALGGSIVAALLLGEWAMVLLYGPAFRPAASLLVILSATVALLVLQLSAAQVLLGLGRARGLWLMLVPTAVVLLLLALNHGSARAIALDGLAASCAGAIVLVLIVLSGKKKPLL